MYTYRITQFKYVVRTEFFRLIQLSLLDFCKPLKKFPYLQFSLQIYFDSLKKFLRLGKNEIGFLKLQFLSVSSFVIFFEFLFNPIFEKNLWFFNEFIWHLICNSRPWKKWKDYIFSKVTWKISNKRFVNFYKSIWFLLFSRKLKERNLQYIGRPSHKKRLCRNTKTVSRTSSNDEY